MEELTKRNGKGVWMREIEKVLKRFGASLEWLMERVGIHEEEIEKIRTDDEMEGRVKSEVEGDENEKHRWRTRGSGGPH